MTLSDFIMLQNALWPLLTLLMLMPDDTWWCLMMLDDAWWCLMMLDDAWWCLMTLDKNKYYYVVIIVVHLISKHNAFDHQASCFWSSRIMKKFSVLKVTLESQMSLRSSFSLSIHPSPKLQTALNQSFYFTTTVTNTHTQTQPCTWATFNLFNLFLLSQRKRKKIFDMKH